MITTKIRVLWGCPAWKYSQELENTFYVVNPTVLFDKCYPKMQQSILLPSRINLHAKTSFALLLVTKNIIGLSQIRVVHICPLNLRTYVSTKYLHKYLVVLIIMYVRSLD